MTVITQLSALQVKYLELVILATVHVCCHCCRVHICEHCSLELEHTRKKSQHHLYVEAGKPVQDLHDILLATPD